MPDILSLSRARKAKARSDKEARAAANRVKFGRTRVERQREAAEQARAAKQAEAHKRED